MNLFTSNSDSLAERNDGRRTSHAADHAADQATDSTTEYRISHVSHDTDYRTTHASHVIDSRTSLAERDTDYRTSHTGHVIDSLAERNDGRRTSHAADHAADQATDSTTEYRISHISHDTDYQTTYAGRDTDYQTTYAGRDTDYRTKHAGQATDHAMGGAAEQRAGDHSERRDRHDVDNSVPGSRKKRRIKRVYDLGLVGLIVILILMESFVFRNEYFYGLSPGFIGQLGELKATFANHDAERIEVAILGDSQSMDALLPKEMAKFAGYDESQIFNFSLSGGSAYDIEKTYRVYEEALPNLRKAFVVVSEHQFNEARTVEDIKFKYYADLFDRLQVMDHENYGDLLLGWLFKSYDMRTVWTMMIEKQRAGELRDAVPVHEGGLPPVTWSPSTSRTMEYAQEVADRWFENFEMGGLRSQSFERLIRDLRAKGIEVVILRLPRADYFEQAISERYAAEQRQVLDFIYEVADRYGAEIGEVPNDELDLDTHFRDTNHVNPEGALWVSRYVAEKWLAK